MNIIQIINLVIGILLFTLFTIASIISMLEHEKRAAIRFFILAFPIFLIYSVSLIPFFGISEIYSAIILAITIISVLINSFPYKGKFVDFNETPIVQIDERDTMFSRNELKPGTEKFNNYYAHNTDKKILDDKFRSKAGLLSPSSSAYNPLVFASAEASFYTVGAFKDYIDGEINEFKKETNPEEISRYITRWSKKLGAIDVGITELKSYHLYSVKGRREKYGKAVMNKHKFAIAFTVEMEKFNIDTAPDAPAVFESAQQYLSSGTIAIQIASFIRNLGYSAKAHIDGNYDLVCPLIARDAGMGEIGRMGLLMTPKLGPRVRIAVVTTDIPLITKRRKINHTVHHFCEICKKCADNCPSKAISFENRQSVDDVSRWQINSEACFTYWCLIGTDCGICIKVCPYAHPNNLMHNIVRIGIKNNLIFRYLALYLDDFFYGKKPSKNKFPKWMRAKYN